jgi:hypothetical protein
MTRSRTTTRFAAALMITVTFMSAALASPNDGRFKKSAEGMRKQLDIACAQIKNDLAVQESLADDRAGTKDAKPFAEAADALWAAGEKAGCSWAQ